MNTRKILLGLKRHWKKLTVAIIGLVIVIALITGHNPADCEKAVEAFENDNLTLAELLKDCEHIFTDEPLKIALHE